MQQLHVVGFTTDHDGLIFSARKGAKSGGFLVALDNKFYDTIDEAARVRDGDDGASKRRGARRPSMPRPESALSPRDIQMRLRAGRSIANVAAEAGVDEEWVLRFAAPIQAEQARVIAKALGLTFAKARLGPSGRPLGEAVWWNVADKGALMAEDTFDQCWTAQHLRDSAWIVRFEFMNRKKRQRAEWEVDARENTLMARNRLAADLGYVEPGRRGRPPVPLPPAAKPAAKRPTAAKVATKRSSTSRRSGAKTVAKKRPAAKKRAPAKRTAAKRTAAKRTAAKRPTAKRAPTKRRGAKRAPAKRTAKRATAKRPTARKTAVKKATVKRAVSKTVAPKKLTAKKVAPKKVAAKKAAPKKVAPKKVAAKKAAPKKVAPKKVAAKRPPAKRPAVKRPAVKRAGRTPPPALEAGSHAAAFETPAFDSGEATRPVTIRATKASERETPPTAIPEASDRAPLPAPPVLTSTPQPGPPPSAPPPQRRFGRLRRRQPPGG